MMKKPQLNLMINIIGLLALVWGVLGAVTESPSQPQPQPQPQLQQTHHQQQRQQTLPSSRVRSSAYRSTSAATAHCEYKELMTKLHDRVGILATLDEDQRHRLEVIDKKIDNLVESNTGRMESLKAQQMDFQQRLDSFEHIQRLSRNTLDELKDLSRPIRQAAAQEDQDAERYRRNQSDLVLSVPERLDALASLLASTAINVRDLQQSVRKVLQNNRRNLQRHRAGQQPRPGYMEHATSCLDEYLAINGILKLQLTPQSESFYVPCDKDWTVIMSRGQDGINFERSWLEYKDGFGNLAGDFFIGLDKLHALTSSTLHELRIVLEDFQGNVAFAGYSSFAIGSEKEAYPLSLLGQFQSELQPSAGDSLSYQAGAKFSTIDNDNDNCVDCSCAQRHRGAGWFNNCATSNLMGTYVDSNYANAGQTGIFWEKFQGLEYSLFKVRMLIRPIAPEDGGQR
ncbi:angiopoietin-related protein 7 isoform X2 [Drosophila willistoni]|uniref:angiopoietin-related protein 7 isoform X2 n=1 Tax=Drosophila willistoni TaxID=7260 RepID=UPI000C26D2B1|nr:angiopoietin-related protein 7 isoform X2 [Drosophila willistoni]